MRRRVTRDDCAPDVAQERAALIAWRLALGERLSVIEIAHVCGTSRQGAWLMITHLSRILPIYCDDQDNWQQIPKNSAPASTGR
jgi:hypothetical protein